VAFRIRLEIGRIVLRIAPLFVTVPRFILPFPLVVVREVPVPVVPPEVEVPVVTIWLVSY